jgi:hypothetical protein
MTLADFGIELTGSWSSAEQAEILSGTLATARALCVHGAGNGTALDAFRVVMLGMDGSNWRQIRFGRINASGTFCTTTKNPTNAYSAYIDCNVNLLINQYTAVHEYGHVFVGRTTIGGVSSYLFLTENPNGQGEPPLTDSNGRLVMGYQGYALDIGSRIDWQRSNVVFDNGWGSAALWDQVSAYTYNFPLPPPPTPPTPPIPTQFPVIIPQIGPCGDGAPSLPAFNGTPFPYQQNPCTFPNWETTDPRGQVAEIEEAAADMFLNWIYWKAGDNTAFQNQIWRSSGCYPNGCADSNLAGQARRNWMDQTMTTLFDEFNW